MTDPGVNRELDGIGSLLAAGRRLVVGCTFEGEAAKLETVTDKSRFQAAALDTVLVEDTWPPDRAGLEGLLWQVGDPEVEDRGVVAVGRE